MRFLRSTGDPPPAEALLGPPHAAVKLEPSHHSPSPGGLKLAQKSPSYYQTSSGYATRPCPSSTLQVETAMGDPMTFVSLGASGLAHSQCSSASMSSSRLFLGRLLSSSEIPDRWSGQTGEEQAGDNPLNSVSQPKGGVQSASASQNSPDTRVTSPCETNSTTSGRSRQFAG
jgi:hypothetical protein